MKNCSPKRIAIGVVVVVVLVGIITPVAYFASKSSKKDEKPPKSSNAHIPSIPAKLSQRIDCYPEANVGNTDITEDECKKRNCVYVKATGNVPSCFFPTTKDYGFAVLGKEIKTSNGFKVKLKRRGRSPFEDRSKPFDTPMFEVEMRGDNILRFKFDDATTDRYHVPVDINLPEESSNNPKYKVQIVDRENFAFTITRTSTKTVIFDTRVGGLTLTDKFLQLSTQLPSSYVYGFGENLHASFRHDLNYRVWPMFSRDQGTGSQPVSNLYGVHPFYTCVENDGNAHGVLLLNSNAQEYSLTPLPMLTYRTIGGILDFYLFLGPTPEMVIQQYTSVIGRPFMPPYWALGFHLSRYGYNNLQNMQAAYNRTNQHLIPLDVQYADIDHMLKQMDFTIDDVNFKGLDKYFAELRKNGMKTIIILDPCFITNKTDYEPYSRLTSVNGSIMWPSDYSDARYKDSTGAMLGYVWPNGKVVFPDFFKNKTKQVWKDLIVAHRKNKLEYDGMWIDMNEPANFGTNEVRPWNWPVNATLYWSLRCPESDWDDPPYKTMATFVHESPGNVKRLSDKTLCMVARQGDDNELLHYNVHSLYGFSQSQPTLEAMQIATKERSMVLSRSTFPGSGKYAGHWLGDNDSSWKQLAYSIIGMLEFNLFGIPFIGSDICGFFQNTTTELCLRWMQLGAFYPFSRNHNGIGFINQDPGALGEDVAEVSRVALETRYWLLPYLYTLFYHAHTDGHTVVRPLHHEFPTDAYARGIDKQFMWGSSLLISPILERGQKKLTYFLPKGRWYNFYTGDIIQGPKNVTMDVTLKTEIPLHVRGGSILPMQAPALNTTYSRKNPMKLLIALDNDDVNGGKAVGDVFWDDGVSIGTVDKGDFFLGKIEAEGNGVRFSLKGGRADSIKDVFIDTIQVMGVKSQVTNVTIEHTSMLQKAEFSHNRTTKVLVVTNVILPLNEPFGLRWAAADFTHIDCYPERLGGLDLVNSTKCSQRHCTYTENDNDSPDCHFPTANYGYKKTSMETTALGWKVKLSRKSDSPFGNAVNNIHFEVEMRSDSIIRFKLTDADKARYEVPVTLDLPTDGAARDPRYDIQIITDDPFHFHITRRSSGTVLWDTSVGGLTFEDQFLQIATALPSRNIYGFGENVHSKFRHDLWWKQWPMFSRDEPTGDQNSNNHYGVHPFYMCMEDDGQSHGVLLLNSNAQDYAFTPHPMLIYRTIGGVLDFYMFLGPEPENVVQQYTGVIGRPYLPPYWSLGFQLSRYGYNKIDNLKDAVRRTREAGIPLDVQYADIDHMDERKDFTLDKTNFRGLDEYFKELRQDGMRTIIILDPALISNVSGYTPYKDMTEVDGNIKWPLNYTIPAKSSDKKGAVLGYVWPKGKVVFPDFFKNKTKEVWSNLIQNHHSVVSFDGLWIDMNEPANFGTNEARAFNWPESETPYWTLKCVEGDPLEDPPYRTMAAFIYDSQKKKLNRISDKTICMVSRQGDNGTYSHYDVHSLYGWSQSEATLKGLRSAVPNKRGIVISRSTFPGSGKYVGHWLGDNSAIWNDLSLSVIGSLEFNLFGIPYIGADICGFFGDSNAELCTRWMQLGAFYTFSRNHNGINYIDQDPASFGKDTAKASKEVMETRYWLLPYLYTLFYHAHVRGDTVMRPLHHEFPIDPNTYGIDQQFLWGPALLISPILSKGQNILEMYLPKGHWYDFYTGLKVTNSGNMVQRIDIKPTSKIPLHIRGGYILPMQKPKSNTQVSRKEPFTLKVAISSDGRRSTAGGELFWDDGESINTTESGQYYYSKFDYKDQILRMFVNHYNGSSIDNLIIDEIHVLGASDKINFAYLNNSSESLLLENNGMLIIRNLSLSLKNNFVIELMTERKLSPEEASRVDCYPDIDSTSESTAKSNCEKRGCIWNSITVPPSVPKCYIDNTIYGYEMINNTVERNSQWAELQWKNQSSMFSGDKKHIQFQVKMLNEKALEMRFVDPNEDRYEVPVTFNNISRNPSGTKYNITYTNDGDGMFYVQVRRTDTGTVIWDTSIGGLTFSNQFLQISTKLPSSNIYGFGENRHFTFKHNTQYKRWPMFSRDNGVNWGDYANLYGVHPFYMCVEDDGGKAHGVLFLNSNAMEILVQPYPALTYRTVGGILNFYVFLGENPTDVLQQYIKFIGLPHLPPYWSLGFQLSRYGYNHIDNMKKAVGRTIDSGIPYDVQYADIDHMDERKDFTIDASNFGDLPEYVDSLKRMGVRFITILDPALISNETGYNPYDYGKQLDVFIKWPNGTDMLGFVWPKGKVVFPDFLNAKTHNYWKELVVNHSKVLSFDGLWIDMNEPANFGTNEEKPFNWPEKDKPYWSLKCPGSSLDDPPYKPRGVFGPRLSDKTLCMVAEQGGGKYKHYNVHSLYGWSQTEPTIKALQSATGKRGVVISRSTYPSSGRHAGHWLGDNDSQWRDMHDSIIGILEFNMFGIPYIGADICGFFGDSTSELCERWMQLGAFYTFSRNHNTIGTKPQDPAYFGSAVADSSRRALNIRYALLPYLYTLFYHAHTDGLPVIRSMVQTFPTDVNTRDIDSQFLWGEAILIIPVLQSGKREVEGYFPKGRWFDYQNGQEVEGTEVWHTIPAPRDRIPVFIRGGFIIPTQQPANNTANSRSNPFKLFVTLNENETAKGDLFWDDGESMDTTTNDRYFHSSFGYIGGNITMTINKNSTEDIDTKVLDDVVIYGLKTQVDVVEIWNSSLISGSVRHTKFEMKSNALYIRHLNLPMIHNFKIRVSRS